MYRVHKIIQIYGDINNIGNNTNTWAVQLTGDRIIGCGYGEKTWALIHSNNAAWITH